MQLMHSSLTKRIPDFISHAASESPHQCNKVKFTFIPRDSSMEVTFLQTLSKKELDSRLLQSAPENNVARCRLLAPSSPISQGSATCSHLSWFAFLKTVTQSSVARLWPIVIRQIESWSEAQARVYMCDMCVLRCGEPGFVA